MGALSGILRSLGQSAEQRAISRALATFAKGDLARAIDTLKEAHARSPENNEILFELVPMLVYAGRGPESGETLRKILRRDRKCLPRIMEIIEQAKAKRANVSPLQDALADHYIRAGDLKHALESLSRTGAEDLKALMARHQARWDSVRKGAPDAKLTKPSLHSAYYLALAHEHLRDYGPAAEIYRSLARNNPEELERILTRLEALLNKDYQNVALRVAVAGLLLQSGREDDAGQQFQTALDTDRRCAAAIVRDLAPFLEGSAEARPAMRWILALSNLAAGSPGAALAELSRLIEAGERLEETIELLHGMAARDDGRPARRLLAHALLKSGKHQSALETLLALAESDGLPSIRAPLEALAEAQPEIARVHLMLADLNLAEARLPEAVDCLRRARSVAPSEDSLMVPRITRLLEDHPDSAEAHLLLSDIQIAAGEIDRAVVLLRHLVREAPGGASAALERLTEILSRSPSAPRARVGAAEACLALADHGGALEHLGSVAESHPDLTAEFLHAVGLLAEAAPDQYRGIAALLRDLEPRSPLPHAVRFALGDAAFHGGDPAAATAAYREVLAAVPERVEEIREALERFDRKDSRAVEVPYLLALIHLDRKDHEAALVELSRGGAVNVALLDRIIARYEQILREAPGDAAARCGYVQALLLARRYDQVLSVGDETIKAIDDGRAGRIMMLMGEAMREKGDRDGAAKRFYAAYSRDRSLAGDVSERLTRLVRDEGSHALASLALGKMMASEGRAAEARESLGAACQAEPRLRDTVLTELRALMGTCPGDPETGLMAIGLLLEVRDMHQALEIASSLLDDHPEHAGHLAGPLETIVEDRADQGCAHFELGRALQILGFHARSAAAFLNAFRRDDSMAAAVQRRLQESMKESPSTAEPYLASSAIHATRGKHQAAAEVLSRATAANPDLAARLLPRLEEIWKQARTSGSVALVYADACLTAGEHEKAAAAFGDTARKDGSLQKQALEGLDRVIEARPDQGAAFLERARIHAARLRLEPARADLDRAFTLAPHRLTEILEVAETLHASAPESAPCAVLVADLLIAARREEDAKRRLEEASTRPRSPEEDLAVTIRLWRLALSRRDEEDARAHLEKALRLAPDRDQFLSRVHQVRISALAAEATALRARVAEGSRRSSDLERALRALIELGRMDEADAELHRGAEVLQTEAALRLRAELALRRGDYPRACENLLTLGPSPLLAFGAERAGDHATAARTLETLAAGSDEPGLRRSLQRVYRALVAADLTGGSRRLQAETILTFGEGKSS